MVTSFCQEKMKWFRVSGVYKKFSLFEIIRSKKSMLGPRIQFSKSLAVAFLGKQGFRAPCYLQPFRKTAGNGKAWCIFVGIFKPAPK
jgi:hypothetical protein